MDTINNVAAAAAKAVWGDNKDSNAQGTGTSATSTSGHATTGNTSNTTATTSDNSGLGGTTSNLSSSNNNVTSDTTSSSTNNREEPVSGQLGDTSKGEPYDAGNKDENTSSGDTSLGASSTDKRTATEDTTTGNASLGATSGGNTSSVADRTANPAKAQDSSHGTQDSTKGQNDVRDPEDPIAQPETQEKRSNVNDTGEPQPEGPGPRPLTEVAKEHHGDAGKSNEDVDKAGDDGAEHAPGPTGTDEEDGPNKKSTGEGTGEQYVKSSGFKADGGDFDASAPGAGREADRLLEEKGIHRDDPNKASGLNEATGADAAGETHKRSLGDKIKEKLHRS